MTTTKKREAFKIPKQPDVVDYIKEKMKWPERFCIHYAEKFWHFYNSNGWKVSGRAPMKSWESAFNAQWQHIKVKEDVEFLNKCIAEDPKIPVQEKGNAYLNQCLLDHSKNWDKIKDESYAQVYDYMKERKMIVLTDEEKAKAQIHAKKHTVIAGKALCVKMIFDKMVTYGQRFNDVPAVKDAGSRVQTKS